MVRGEQGVVALTETGFDSGTPAGRVSALLLRPPDAWVLYVLAHGAGAGMRRAFMEDIARLGARATLHVVEGADHSFHVLRRSGRTDAEVLDELADAVARWAARPRPECRNRGDRVN